MHQSIRHQPHERCAVAGGRAPDLISVLPSSPVTAALDLQPLASLGRDRLPAFGRKIVCPVFRTSWLLLLRHYSSVCNGGFEMDVLLTVDGVAERLGTSPRFVRRLVAERRIPFVKVGYHVRVATRDLDAYIAASRVEASGGPKGLRSA